MNTYIISGTINYFVNKELKKIIKDNTYVSYDLACSKLEEVLNEASIVSMFGEKKYIVIRNAPYFNQVKNKLQEEETEKLLRYLNNENKDTYLIFLLDKKPDSRKKITKLIIENNNYIEIPLMYKSDMKNELHKYVEEHNYKIDDKTLYYILDSSLNNFDISIKELDKIMLYYNIPCTINYIDVTKLCNKLISDNTYILVDSIMERKLYESINNIIILKTYKIDPIVIFMSLASEVRKTLYIDLLRNKNLSYRDILKYMNMQEFQYKKYDNYLKIYNRKELVSMLILLSKYDVILKSENIDNELLLYKYIISNCE
jgi:DNA polymerase III subunit delta